MGFRNPVTTAVDPIARDTAGQALDAALHGIIPGSRLAADAIDGRTITGATLRTASTGQRVQIDSTYGLVGYDATGAALTQVGTDGRLSASQATIQGEIVTADYGARVRIAESTDDLGRPVGAVQLDPGIDGSTPGGLSGIGNTTTDAFGNPVTNGSSVRLVGGSLPWGGGTSTAPSLSLNLDGDSQGGFRPSLRLDSPSILFNGREQLRQRGWYIPRSNYTANASDGIAASTFVSLIDGTIADAPPGDYLITGQIVASSAANATAFLRFGHYVGSTLQNVSGDMRCDRTTLPGPISFTYALTWGGGALRVQLLFQSSAQTATIQRAGSAVNVAWLGPRA